MKKNTRILTLVFVVAFLFVGCLPTTPPNEAPIITSTPVTTATIGVLYTYDVNATDPDGDTLTYSLTVKPKGMTINSKTGVINWRPTSTQVGNNPVSVKVSDKSLSVIQSFTIKVSKPPVVNLAPTINSIPITTATVGITYFYDVNATDPNGDTLTYSLTTSPSGMTISSASGLIMWTPTVKGSYAVVVKVSDGALSDTQGFTVTVSELPVVNQAPVIVSIPGDTATVGIKYTYTIKAIDPDGDAITYSLVSRPTGMTFNDIATISWTPVLGQVGDNGVIVKASDGVLNVTQSFTIKVSKPPIPLPEIYTITASAGPGGSISPSGDLTVNEGSDKVFTITPDNVFYSITDVLVDLVSVGAVDSYTFINVTKDHTIHATFGPLGRVYNQTKGTYHDTIKLAIEFADDGDTILVSAGMYNEHIINQFAPFNKSFNLIGAGADVVTWTAPSGEYPLQLDQQSGMSYEISGFKFVGDGAHCIKFAGVDFYDLDVHDNVFENINPDPDSFGLFMCRIVASSVRVHDNVFNTEKGICMSNAVSFDIYNNEFNVNVQGIYSAAGCKSTYDVGDHKIYQNTFNGLSGDAITLDYWNDFHPNYFVSTIIYNNFESIGGYAVNVTTDRGITENAEDNWWGDASGPHHGTTNPDGLGNAVSDNVDFDPWLEDPH